MCSKLCLLFLRKLFQDLCVLRMIWLQDPCFGLGKKDGELEMIEWSPRGSEESSKRDWDQSCVTWSSQLLSEKGEPCILVLENLSQVLDFIWVSFSSLVKLEVELYDLKDLFQLEYSMIMSRVEVWLLCN